MESMVPSPSARRRILLSVLALAAVARAIGPASAAEFVVRGDEAIFAVITHKAGVASGFAHDHLIVAKDAVASVNASETALESGSFKFKADVAKLVVDDPKLQKKWYPTFEALGVLSSMFKEASPEDRATVRGNMVAASQLDMESFPSVSAEVSGLSKGETTVGKVTFGHLANLQITLKDKTVKKQVPARVKLNGASLEVEALGAYKFSEFGIKPYSAMLGAVRNSDDFHLYVSFKAEKK